MVRSLDYDTQDLKSSLWPYPFFSMKNNQQLKKIIVKMITISMSRTVKNEKMEKSFELESMK